MGIRSSKYGWNFRNSHRWLYFWLEQGFPSCCLMCSSCFSPLGGACPRFAGLLMVNIGLDLKPATILENASVWNTQTCEFVATRIPETSQISSCYVYFRFFVTATDRENGTFSIINISKTIAGATGGDRSYWKSNKQATRKWKNWTQKASKKKTKHLFENITPNTRETNAFRWSLKTQKKINTEDKLTLKNSTLQERRSLH